LFCFKEKNKKIVNEKLNKKTRKIKVLEYSLFKKINWINKLILISNDITMNIIIIEFISNFLIKLLYIFGKYN